MGIPPVLRILNIFKIHILFALSLSVRVQIQILLFLFGWGSEKDPDESTHTDPSRNDNNFLSFCYIFLYNFWKMFALKMEAYNFEYIKASMIFF